MISDFKRELSFRPGKAKAIRVSMPIASLYDLDRFQGLQKEILGRLGCAACTSGYDIRWDFTRNFIIDENAKIHEVGSFAK